MRNVLARIFDTSRYTGMVERERARVVYIINTLLIVMAILFLAFPLGPDQTFYWQNPTYLTLAVLLFATVAASIVLTRRGHVWIAGLILFGLSALIIGVPTALGGLYSQSSGMILILIVLLGSLLNGGRGLILGLVAVGALLLLGLSERAVVPPPTAPNSVTELFIAFTLLLVIGGLASLSLRYARLTRAEGASVAVQERLKMAEIAQQITERVAQRVPLAELLNVIVTQVVSEFPEIYHAQVFLIDPAGDAARLAASTGEVGKKLIASHHSLGVGSLSVIGQVTYRGEPIVARAGTTDSVHRRNEFLPDTVSEAAFPLRIGNMVIGALDLQSTQPNVFPPQMVEAFLALADSTALAIDNVRQFERAEARIQENQQLVEQARAALHEVERLNERLTGRAWSEYLRGQREDMGLSVDFLSHATERAGAWTNTMAEAVRFNHFVQEQQPDRQVIAVPLRVRGQVVGAMEFELDLEQGFTPEDLALVQEVSERFGLAAENTRLIEESQRIAQREALVNEISSRLQAANNIESTLDEAARSLRNALKASRVAIRLGAPPANGKQGEGEA